MAETLTPPQALDRRDLAERHYPYVRAIAGKVKRGVAAEVEFDDLVEYGMVGLLEAAARFDPGQGVSFATFSYYRIRGAIYDGLRGMGWMSRTAYARARFEERANALLEAGDDAGVGRAGGSGPARAGGSSAAGDGDDAGVNEGEGDGWADGDAAQAAVPEADSPALTRAARGLARAVESLAAVYITSLDAAADVALVDQAPAADETLGLAQARSLVRRTLAKLPPQERQLLELYYYEDRTLEQVGTALGLSKSWTSRLHARAIDKLNRMLSGQLGD